MLGPGKATRAATADQTAVSRPPHARLRVTAQPSSPQACGVGLGRPQDSGPWQATLAGGGRGEKALPQPHQGLVLAAAAPRREAFFLGPLPGPCTFEAGACCLPARPQPRDEPASPGHRAARRPLPPHSCRAPEGSVCRRKGNEGWLGPRGLKQGAYVPPIPTLPQDQRPLSPPLQARVTIATDAPKHGIFLSA